MQMSLPSSAAPLPSGVPLPTATLPTLSILALAPASLLLMTLSTRYLKVNDKVLDFKK